MQTMSLIILNLPIFKTLYDLADVFWLSNVEACIQETRFLSLDWQTMSELMMREKYNERIVFVAAIKWVEHDLKSRRQHLEELFTRVVRLPQLSAEFLSDVVVCHPLVESVHTSSFQRVFIEACQYQGMKNPDTRFPAASAMRFLHRQSPKEELTIYVYAVKGVTHYRFTSIEKKLVASTFVGANIQCHAHVYWKGRAFLFGGELSRENPVVALASIQELDLQSQEWKTLAFEMQSPRLLPAAIGKYFVNTFELLSDYYDRLWSSWNIDFGRIC